MRGRWKVTGRGSEVETEEEGEAEVWADADEADDEAWLASAAAEAAEAAEVEATEVPAPPTGAGCLIPAGYLDRGAHALRAKFFLYSTTSTLRKRCLRKLVLETALFLACILENEGSWFWAAFRLELENSPSCVHLTCSCTLPVVATPT